MPNVKKTFYSVRMRAAQGGPHEQGGIHISGAERIVAKNELETTIKQLLLRAQNHTKGSPDFINFNVEELQAENIFYASTLPITTLQVKDYQAGRQTLKLLLTHLGISPKISTKALNLIYHKKPTDRGQYGAWLLEAHTGQLIGPPQGVRVSRMDLTPEARAALIAHHLNNNHFSEALTLASKIMLHPASLAEICWSDDPDYVAGYLASRQTGYLRIPYLKPVGVPVGGRVILLRKTNLQQYLNFLTRQPVLFSQIGNSPKKGVNYPWKN